MGRQVIQRLPPRVEYPDLPPFPDNCDTVPVRTLSAAWNALFLQELTDFSFIAFAREVGVSPSALYRYYPTISALAAELARVSLSSLLCEMSHTIQGPPEAAKKIPRHEFVRILIRNYLGFAAKRPRHYALAISKQYAMHENVARMQEQLRSTLNRLLDLELRRAATPAELHGFWALLHGSTSLVAAGQPAHTDHVVAMLDRYFDFLRAAGGG